MRRRALTTLTLFAALALTLGWLPNSAWLRGVLGSLLVDAAATLDATLSYDAISGYAWRGLTLSDPRLVADGLDVRAAAVSVTWFLPSLVVGELPLRIDVAALAGDVEVGRLAWPAAGDEPAALRVRVDGARIDVADLRVAEVPFDLPDLSIERLEATSAEDGRWQLSTALATAEGRLEGSVRGRLGDAAFEVALERGDARVARHWWDGIEAGSVRGELTVAPGLTSGRFELADGALDALGTAVTNVAGPIAWRNDVIEIAWSGDIVGGRFDAGGTVDLGDARWQAQGSAEAPLSDASRALLAILGAADLPGADGGVVRAGVTAEGWTAASVAADIELAGDWLGSPLAVEDFALAYDSDRGLSLALDGRWGEGPLRLRGEPRDGATDWIAEAGPLGVLGVPVETVAADWTTGDGPVRGRAAGRAGTGPWSLAADVVLDADGLQAFVTGDAWGGGFAGAFATAPAAGAAVEGGVTWQAPDAWASGAARVEARVSGDLSAPTFTLRVAGDGPVTPRVAGLDLPALAPDLDLRGEATASLVAGRLRGEGRLGPVAFGIDGDAWTADIDELRLSGLLRGAVGPATASGNADGWTATARTTIASGPPIPGGAEPLWRLADDIAWRLEGGPDGWTASADDGRWRATSAGPGSWTIAGAPVAWLGREGTLDARGTFAAFDADVTLPELAANASWSAGSLQAVVLSGAQRLSAAWEPGGRLDVDGGLDLGIALRGWTEVGGVASLSAAWETDRDALPRGQATVELEAPWPATLRLSADGASTAWDATSELIGVPLRSTGVWRPGAPEPLAGALTWGEFVELRIAGDGLSGSGTWGGWGVADVRVDAQPWRLRLTPAGVGEATFGATRATFDLTRPRLDAVLDLGLQWGGRPARLTGRVGWSAARPEGELEADLELAGGARASLAGDLAGVTGTLSGPVADWASAVSPLLAGPGEAALHGELAGTLTWSDAGALELRADWRDAADRPVALAWTPAGGELRADGLRARLAPDGHLEIEAEQARVAPLLRRGDLSLTIDGRVALDLAGGASAASVPSAAAAGGGTLEGVAAFGGADLTARLVGGETPTLDLSATAGGLRAWAEGPVTLGTAVGWRGSWRLADDAGLGVDGGGAFVASAVENRLDGSVSLAAGALGPLAWPRLAAEVDARPEGVALAGTAGLAGTWPAGLTATVTLAGVPTSLRLRPADRGWTLDVGGEIVTAVWSGELDAWVLRGRAQVQGLSVGVEAEGSAASAAGRWSLAYASAPDAPWAAGGLELDGGALEVVLRGADLELARAVELEPWPPPAAQGELRARVTTDGWSLDGRLEAVWPPDAGVPVGARLEAAGQRLSLEATAVAAGVASAWRVSGDDLRDWPRTRWSLSGEIDDVGWSGEARTDAERVAIDAASADGRWRLTADGGRSGVARFAGPDGLTADLAWRLDPALELELDAAALGFSLAAHLGRPADGGDGPWLRLDAWHAEEPWRAHLAGPLDPLALTGAIALTEHAVAARLVSAPTWRLDWGELALTWEDGDLVVHGRSEDGQLPLVSLVAERLRWRPGAGWAGAGRVGASFDGGALGRLEGAAELSGAGELEAELALSLDGVAIGGASLRVGPDPTAGVRGDAELVVRLAPLTASTLAASGPVSYGAAGLAADLALQLAGDREAAGRLTVDGGTIAAQLSGPGLALTSELRGPLGTGRLELRELAVDDELPFLRAPRLSADAEVAWDASGWSWRVDGLRLATAGSLLEAGGVGGPNGRVTASARVDADLRDLLLDAPIHGRLRGPVSFDGEVGDPLAGMIAASLEAEDVRWNGLDATWQAALAVTGSAGDPLVRGDWTADGPDARLAGDAAWWPARASARLRADGRLLGAGLTLDIGLGASGFSGGGELELIGEAWSVTSDAGRLAVAGSGRWRGWSVAVDPDAWRADVAGDLAALPAAGGSVAGTIDLGAPRRPVVDLAWQGASIAGIDLGAGRLGGDAESGWVLRGSHVTGALSPDLQDWTLALDDVATPVGETRASLVARGTPAATEVTATWRGDSPAGPVDLRLDAADAGDGWRGEVRGRAFAGAVVWPLTLEGEVLAGSGHLTGGNLSGVPLEADLTLAGTIADPELALGLTFGDDDAWRLDGDWRAGVARVEASLPAALGVPLRVSGRAWPEIDLDIDGADAGRLRLTGDWRNEALRFEGALVLDAGGLRVEAAAPADLRVRLPELGGGLSATLPDVPLLAAIEEVRDEGWWWRGIEGWSGSLRVLGPGGAWLVSPGVSLAWRGADATVGGRLDGGEAALDLRVDLSRLGGVLAPAGAWPWSQPLAGVLRWSDGRLSLTTEAPWGLDATVDLAARTGAVAVEVLGRDPAGGPPASVVGRLTLDADGWGGRLRVAATTDVVGEGPATVDLTVTGAGGHLALDAAVLASRGSATAVGRWDAADLLPGGWGPGSTPLRELDARIVGLDLAGIAGVPGIAGTVGGSATLRGDRLFGLLVSEALTYGGRTDPARLEFQADLADAAGVTASGRLDLVGADAQFDLDAAGVSGLVRLERFPLHAWVEAVVGPSDVRAEVTGAVRGAWRWGRAAPHDLRVAAERIELERAGVVTVGEFSGEWDGDALTIGRAAFEGRGTWRARGRITPDVLDLELLAQAADFGPLLGLVPSLARNGVSAEGDLVVTAHGTPASPDVALRTDDLRLLVAGTRYQLLDTRFTLRGQAWSGRSEIVAISPLSGRLELATDGRIGPFPDPTFALDARAVGDLDVPFLGLVEGIEAELGWSDDAAPVLGVRGTLGSPFTIEGSLAPLDLRASGRDLRVTVPFLAIADARLDADLRLADDEGGVRLAGRVDASEARVDLATRAAVGERTSSPPAADPEAAAAPAGATGAGTPAPVGDPRERFRFDGVRIVAPQRVTISESIGNAEAGVDLTLGGTAAAPRLSGEVVALRGTVRFAGRDLELTQAVATFDPTRGVYPAVRVAGRTAFDKARIAPGGASLRFLSPAGQRFEVTLLLEGEAIDGEAGFTLDLTPTLSSDAIVEGLDGGGARAFTELELLTLLTLGRLEEDGAFAGAVAQSALDTAVDVLITSEIQAALSEALGVEVVELRTTALSSLLDGQDPFGVSLRLGGYLSDEVFASYRISTLGGDAFSNEVALAYQLGPVAMDVTGRFDVAAGAVATGGPSLAVGLRYGLAPGWALELGVDLSTERSTARLGVTWRW